VVEIEAGWTKQLGAREMPAIEALPLSIVGTFGAPTWIEARQTWIVIDCVTTSPRGQDKLAGQTAGSPLRSPDPPS
jgi:hypothetical protein